MEFRSFSEGTCATEESNLAWEHAAKNLTACAFESETKLEPSGLWLLGRDRIRRSEEHTSELQSLMRISYAVFCLKKKNTIKTKHLHNLQTQTNNISLNTYI